MPNDLSLTRYLTTYRQAEVRWACQFALRGESLAFMGVAGVGKSNLVNFLCTPGPARAKYLGQEDQIVHFALVDGRAWQRTPESLWKLMLGGLTDASRGIPAPPESSILPFSDEDRAWSKLQSWVQKICRELRHWVVFVLDDFDRVFETGPLEMLDRLNTLRHAGNRDRLAYLVLTQRLPHVLGRRYNLENESKFYHLFRHDLYALEPYTPDDAFQMLRYLNIQAGKPLQQSDLAPLYKLAGGHAQLLKTVFNIRAKEGPLGRDAIADLLDKADVQQECRRILSSLHEQEQEVAIRAAQAGPLEDDSDTLDHLVRRGLIVRREPLVWFSPLMQRFLARYVT